MQHTKNYCFIDQIMDFRTSLFLLDENYKILQYKILNKINDSKLNNIYCGIIEKVDYSIESVFVKIEKNLVGFLSFKHLSEFYADRKSLKKGDKILVQVIRDCLKTKSVKLTNNIVLSNVFCVFAPFGDGIHGISSNIKADQRVKFKEFLHSLNINGTLLIRTAAYEASIEDIIKDYQYLQCFFEKLYTKFKNAKGYKMLFKYDELLHILRSYSLYLLDVVFVKNKKLYDIINQYNVNNLIKFPKIVVNNNLDFLNLLDSQLDSLYQRELILPSKASIIIEKTEAMVTIDVNSKQCMKFGTMEETAFFINMEAVSVIVDQIILRNLGGIIAVDLIDMKNEDNINSVLARFKQLFKRDKASLKIMPMNELSVLLISRERKGLSVMDLDYDYCSECENGLVLSKDFWEYLFLKKISRFHYSNILIIHIEHCLFDSLVVKYGSCLSKYKNLSWKLWGKKGFEIQYQKR